MRPLYVGRWSVMCHSLSRGSRCVSLKGLSHFSYHSRPLLESSFSIATFRIHEFAGAAIRPVRDVTDRQPRELPCPSLLLWNTALRVEIADVAALRPRCRIDRAIDQGRFPRSQRLSESLREPLRIDGIVTDTAKGFDQLVIVRVSSPWPGGSILITRAPRSVRIVVPNRPFSTYVRSMTSNSVSRSEEHTSELQS